MNDHRIFNVWNIGRVAFLVACAFAGWTTAGHSEEVKQITRTVTVYSLADNPELSAKVDAICSDKAVKLTDKARKACETKVFPPLAKNKEFRNSGIGAEFNTLARNRS